MRPPRRSAARAWLIGCWAAVAPWASSEILAQPPVAHAPQFQVNTFTDSVQRHPDVAVDGSGGFAVVWHGFDSAGGDSDQYAVQIRRFGSSGNRAETQLQANVFATGVQDHPQVAGAEPGPFLVVWASEGSSGPDQDAGAVLGRRYAGNGAPGAEFELNSTTASYQIRPVVAAGPEGEFVVVWTSFDGAGTDSSASGIRARRFSGEGSPLGPDFEVNTSTLGYQKYPAVAVDGLGGFVVAWQSDDPDGADESSYGIRARRFGADGQAVGDDFEVNSYTTGDQRYPRVGAAADGGFVVVWQSFGSAGTDSSNLSVQAQRFGPDGETTGDELQVNGYTIGTQEHPDVAVARDGGFLVVWRSGEPSGGTAGNGSLRGRFFDPTDVAADELLVQSHLESTPDWPAAAFDDDGNAIVVWESLGSPGDDDSGQSIQARRFDQLFRDGFESSDTSLWTTPSPN